MDPVASEAARDQLAFTAGIDTILLGSVTYGMFSQYWPEQTTDTELVADALNTTPKLVFSKTLERAPWGSWEEARVVTASASDEVRRLKNEPGKDLVLWGSISIARTLLADGLVDEVQLWICPVLLGSGKRLFADDIDPLRGSFIETKTYEGGVVSIRFAPVRG